MENKKIIKWGIMATGKIAHRFVEDFKYTNNTRIVGVGSRDIDKAKEFANCYNIPKAYGSYEELVKDDEIDVIYVATPHSSHKENVMMCMKNKKAVLCEKTFTVNALEAAEVIDYAKKNRIFLMEAMWTRFLPATIKAIEWIKSGAIGEINMIQVSFGFKAVFNENGRLYNPYLAGGALLDIGIYPISFASMIFRNRPKEIKSICKIGKTGVDEDLSILFDYHDGKMANIISSFSVNLPNCAWILGTNGCIEIPNFWKTKSAKLYVNGKKSIVFEDTCKSNGYSFEIQEVTNCLIEERIESINMPLSETLEIMGVMDEVRKQWDFKYPMEN
jgi:dihydrodiol dehydrogenase / D-xylose 1-dehydrogenase (NADP)